VPQTINQAIPYPAETDTPDVPRDMQSLAVQVDAVLTEHDTKLANTVSAFLDFSSGTAALPDPAPYDGYEVRCKVFTGIHWKLAWSDDDGAWAFVGGPPLTNGVTTVSAETRTANTYAALATPGPILSVPVGLDGHYELRLEAVISYGSGDCAAYMSYKINNGSAGDGSAILQNNQSQAHVSGGQAVTLAGGDVLTAQYRGNNTLASTFNDRRFLLLPKYIQPA